MVPSEVLKRFKNVDAPRVQEVYKPLFELAHLYKKSKTLAQTAVCFLLIFEYLALTYGLNMPYIGGTLAVIKSDPVTPWVALLFLPISIYFNTKALSDKLYLAQSSYWYLEFERITNNAAGATILNEISQHDPRLFYRYYAWTRLSKFSKRSK